MGCCGCVVGPADCGCGPSSGSSGARVGEGSSTPSGEVVPWALYVTGLATDRAPVSSHAPSRSSGRTQTVSKSANSGLLTGVPSTWVLAECGLDGLPPIRPIVSRITSRSLAVVLQRRVPGSRSLIL